ncbi:hypothetical protein BN946_scf184803.g1 [Trametes cinnabarina]|uniref:Uncharacterized protein n=1 Tax=Pycnoporus cinnabarinus TaxID=5643 RepID=A0A060SBS3_PYCCI|nr:hypothetical protein BN946_scf184803.g1 [Trametes cinnabarina]
MGSVDVSSLSDPTPLDSEPIAPGSPPVEADRNLAFPSPETPQQLAAEIELAHPNPYWPLKTSLIGVAYLAHLRFRRYSPRTLPTFTPLRLGELYGSVALIYTVSQERRLAQERVVNDSRLMTLEAAARRQWRHWREIRDSVYQQPEYTETAYDYHPVTYNYFYRTLYEPYADKYPDISKHDWDVLLTQISNTAWSERDDTYIDFAAASLYPALTSTPIAMFARWKNIRFITPFLNGIQRTSFYLWTLMMALQPYQHWAYPLTLQNRERVAEMLREAYPGIEKDAEALRKRYQSSQARLA